MKKLFIFSLLLASITMMAAELKPQRVLVLGDDPMMVSDESNAAVGYATMLQPLFDEAVTVDVQASAQLLPADAAELFSPAQKGDIVLLCKLPVEENVSSDRTMSDVYFHQLVPIVQAAKKKGVKLIMLTPVCPRYFTPEGAQVHRFGSSPEVVRRLCRRDGITLIDLEQLSFDWLNLIGLEASAEMFVPVVPASPVQAKKAAREGNLLTQPGAERVAALVAEAIRTDKKNALNQRLRTATAESAQPAAAAEPAETAENSETAE